LELKKEQGVLFVKKNPVVVIVMLLLCLIVFASCKKKSNPSEPVSTATVPASTATVPVSTATPVIPTATATSTATSARMAYIDNTASSSIVVAKLDGTDKFTIPGITGAYGLTAIFGNKLAYTKAGDLYVVNIEGTGNTQITYGMNAIMPAAAANGSRIAYISSASGNYDIFAINPDGTGNTQVTYTPANEYYLSISADGSKIAFSDYSNPGVVNYDGTGYQIFLLGAGIGTSTACISPDGNSIYARAYNSGDLLHHIYKMNSSDGGSLTSIYNCVNDIGNMRFFTGSNALFYDYYDSTTYQDIYSINTNGTGNVPVITDAGNQFMDFYYWD
jgi:hypothetical protein